MERNAIQRPLKIHFDDYQIKRFNIPKGTSSIMMSDLISGPLPSKIFWGLQAIESYTGSFLYSSTRLERKDLVRINFYVDGKEKDGFPLSMSTLHVCQPYVKWLESCNQDMNGFLSQVLSMDAYANGNFILSADLSEETGSLSFEFEFADALTEDLVLITCGLYERTMKLDHNRNFKIY